MLLLAMSVCSGMTLVQKTYKGIAGANFGILLCEAYCYFAAPASMSLLCCDRQAVQPEGESLHAPGQWSVLCSVTEIFFFKTILLRKELRPISEAPGCGIRVAEAHAH